MIDIEELRRLAQSATPSVGRVCNYQNEHGTREGHVDFDNADLFIASERPQEDAAFYAAANPAAITKLLDRLEAVEQDHRTLLFTLGKERAAVDTAESECLEQARLLRISREREAELLAKLEAAERGRDEVAQQLVQSEAGKRKASEENDALRAKIAEMERRIPVEAIGKLLTQAMDIAVSNGANSISMPDECVEVASWISKIFNTALPGAKGEVK